MTQHLPYAAPPTRRHDLVSLDLLDQMVRPGLRLAPEIERGYRFIIERQEQFTHSTTNRAIAMSARIRLLEHQYQSRDQQACLRSLVELMQRYPEMCRHSRVLAIACEVQASECEPFVTAFLQAGGQSRQVGSHFIGPGYR